MISNGLRKSGCHVVQSEGDADLEIVRAAIALASLSSTTLIGEDTDLLDYFQIMAWMCKAGDMDATNWGWTLDIQQNKYIPIMMNNCPAPDTLLKVIHCNCSTGCASLRCSCRKSGLDSTTACGPCQDGCCENMHSRILLDDDDDDINGN